MAQQNRFRSRINNNKVNIDYLSKDFSTLKNDLINYAKSYFPNTYSDFNETSPGMMLMEMAAYVGDVMSFYIDQQFKEMVLPLSEERRNVINLAEMLGYKVKSTVPAVVELEFRQTVPHDGTGGDDPRIIDSTKLMTFDKGIRVKSTSNSNVFFETLDIVDFSVTGSTDTDPVPVGQDSLGLTNLWEVKRKVLAVSGQTKSITFNITNPKSFLDLNIPEENVVNIISVQDSNGRPWYEVDYLAQDKILSGSLRGDPYSSTNLPVQYQLNPSINVDRRFITRTNHDNTTSLIFGNGLLAEKYSTNQLNSIWQENEDINSLIQGDLPTSISPLIASQYNNSLGESPSHTTLTVNYRVGGGVESNVPSEDIISITNASSKVIGNSNRVSTLSVTNPQPARGGLNRESVNDIKEKAKSYFSAQDRTVTATDYESRILAMPSSYGNVAKVYVNRRPYNEVTGSGGLSGQEIFSAFDFYNDGTVYGGSADSASFADALDAVGDNNGLEGSTYATELDRLGTLIGSLGEVYAPQILSFLNLNTFVLSYNQNKNLAKTTDVIKDNIRNYLSNYKILSDEVDIRDGVVINFGVKFIVEGHNNINKADLKLKCIDEIIKYFNNDFMEFNQIIYTSDLENVIYNNVEGIKVIHELFLTQDANDLNISDHLYAHTTDGTGATVEGVPFDGVSGPTQTSYGHAYITEFKRFYTDYYSAGVGVILPPNSSETPGVFELKNPFDNIKGVVM